MFHGWSKLPGVTFGATIGVTYLRKMDPDFQIVKCQV